MADPADRPWLDDTWVHGQRGWLVEAYTQDGEFVRDSFTPNIISALRRANGYRADGFRVRVLRHPRWPSWG